jgi:hypothetical protein
MPPNSITQDDLEDIEVLYSNHAKRRYWCHDTWVPAGYSVAIIPNELVEKILSPEKPSIESLADKLEKEYERGYEAGLDAAYYSAQHRKD